MESWLPFYLTLFFFIFTDLIVWSFLVWLCRHFASSTTTTFDHIIFGWNLVLFLFSHHSHRWLIILSVPEPDCSFFFLLVTFWQFVPFNPFEIWFFFSCPHFGAIVSFFVLPSSLLFLQLFYFIFFSPALLSTLGFTTILSESGGDVPSRPRVLHAPSSGSTVDLPSALKSSTDPNVTDFLLWTPV